MDSRLANAHQNESWDRERLDRYVSLTPPWSIENRTDFDSLSRSVNSLLSLDEQETRAQADLLRGIDTKAKALLRRAFSEQRDEDLLDLHETLFAIYESAFANPLSPAASHQRAPWLAELRWKLENAWLDHEERSLGDRIEGLPDHGTDASATLQWFEDAAFERTELDDHLADYLAHEASLEDFRFFVGADAYLNYRFFDTLLLAQVHLSESIKDEISRHHWDESGEGVEGKSHTRLFSRTLAVLGLDLPSYPSWRDWRPFAGYNLYLAFGQSRRYQFRALGSLAMPELFDPDRDRAVVQGLQRLGFDAPREFEYYYCHIEVDEDHGPSWLENVIAPIVRRQPAATRELALGGAIRMEAMRRYNQYLAGHFGLLGG